MMNRLRWHLNLIKRKLDWVGLLGIAIILVGIAYFFFTVGPAQEKLTEVRRVLMGVNKNQQTNANQNSIDEQNPSAQLHVFQSSFPEETSINTIWENISILQEKHGLTVERSVYEISPQTTAGLLRYHMNLPLTATYPQVRDFVAELMQANTNLALEHISFKRESADSLLVNANIGLIIYVRAQ